MVKKILIIEDESQTRDLFLKCLTFEGFFALGADSGTTGIALAQAHQPSLIVCDIMMPDMDGYEVLRSLRQNPKTAAIPFIFLTAKVTMADLRQGMEMGADDDLTKPCTVDQFLGAIATRLERHTALLTLFNQNRLPQAQKSTLNSKSGQSKAISSPSSLTPATTSIFPDCPKLDKVFRFIETHYQQSINLRDVAQVAGYSPAYLTNLVQAQTGRTVKQWIIERRMEQARMMLLNTAKPVKQVAEAVGYADVGYFVRQFRQVHGMPPQSWRSTTTLQSVDAAS
ncbi:MAG: DNA-binding response regulator [Leptolyngbyaceae bacterium]|nr:DNA-binding response regulator [Leptolyngbyaceae bacterium]